ncbi:MAG: zinc/iron-chelating domain-containing protein [Desulfotalea sp.]|nr:MAG: zinc/iron-chelating domain-containing protein [Desulfotalea sp.]
MKSRVQKIIANLREFSVVGFLYYLILKLRRREVMIGGSCHLCGACCRSLSLDDGDGWIRNRRAFVAVVACNPEYSCFEIIGADNSGFLLFRCTLISDDGKCTNYEKRFQFCQDFPDKNLPFCGGGLPAGCGYKFLTVIPFSKILTETIDKKNEKNPRS